MYKGNVHTHHWTTQYCRNRMLAYVTADGGPQQQLW